MRYPLPPLLNLLPQSRPIVFGSNTWGLIQRLKFLLYPCSTHIWRRIYHGLSFYRCHLIWSLKATLILSSSWILRLCLGAIWLHLHLFAADSPYFDVSHISSDLIVLFVMQSPCELVSPGAWILLSQRVKFIIVKIFWNPLYTRLFHVEVIPEITPSLRHYVCDVTMFVTSLCLWRHYVCETNQDGWKRRETFETLGTILRGWSVGRSKL